MAIAVVLAGLVSPPRPAPIATDRLGPDSGTAIVDYLAQAQESLSGPDEPRFALVSLRREITPAEAADLAGDQRVAQLVYRLPLARVQTPITVVGVGLGRASVEGSAAVAADTVRRTALAGASTDRQRRVAAVAAERIAADCACVLAMTVRASPSALRALAAHPDVRAVEALAADAVGGGYALAPLLPENTEIVEPLPDDGPVP